jgi:two-component system, response regulator
MKTMLDVDTKSVDVIILEDNPGVQRSIVDCLEEFTDLSKIKTFSKECELWRFIDRQNLLFCLHHKYKPKLIIMDLKIGGIKAFRTLRRLRSLKLTRHTPIVMFSDSSEEADVQKCYELGVNSFVQKPVRYEEFDEAVQAIAYFWIDINRICS